MTAADKNTQQSVGPGEQLRKAREAQGRSFADVVHELHLEPDVVAAIERDDLNGLSAPVFVKGYLRSYAKLLGLPEQAIVDSWRPAEPDAEDFRTLSVQREMKTGTSLSIFVLWILFGLLAVGALLYLFSGSADEPAPESDFVAEPEQAAVMQPSLRDEFEVSVQTDSSAVQTDDAALLEVVEPLVEEVALNSSDSAGDAGGDQPAPAVAAAVVDAESAQPADAMVALQLNFVAECWVEVSADGRRLLYGLEKAGSERSFRVKPPLRFFVGNVDAVDITIAGSKYVIPADVRTGRNTARFALAAEDIEGMQ